MAGKRENKANSAVEKQVIDDLNKAGENKVNERAANIDYEDQQGYGTIDKYMKAGPMARTDWQEAAANPTDRSMARALNNERAENGAGRGSAEPEATKVGNANASGAQAPVNQGGNSNAADGGNANGNTNTNTNTNTNQGGGNMPSVKTNDVPVGYDEVQMNQVGQSSGTTESAGSQQTQGHSRGTSVKTFDADANAAARAAGQDYVNAAPSGYQEALNELGVGEGGPNEKLLQQKLEQGIPFSQAIQEIALQGDADAKTKAEKLAKAKNTMANLMESFRLATDMASGFSGGNIYKREGNKDVVAENKAELEAADRKYQKALDDFNNKMRRLKSEDLTEKRQRAAKLGDVGFGTESSQDNTSNTNTQNHQENTTNSTQSSNQFVQDQVYANDQRVRVAYAQGAAGKENKDNIIVKRPYVDKDGVKRYKEERVRWDASSKARVRSEIYNYLNDKAMSDPNSQINRQMTELCRLNGFGSVGEDGKFTADFDKLKEVLNNNGEDSGYKNMYEPLLLNAYSMFANTDEVMHPVNTNMKTERKEGKIYNNGATGTTFVSEEERGSLNS